MYIEELTGETYVSFCHPRVDFDLLHFLRSSDLLLALLDSITYAHYQRETSPARDEVALVHNMFSGSTVPFKPSPIIFPFPRPLPLPAPAEEEESWIRLTDSCVDLDLTQEWQIIV